MATPEITHRRVGTNGIELAVAECGPSGGRPVVLCHGFPELWYSWRHQLPALAAAGCVALAPDLRGYGGSSRPESVGDYGTDQVGADLVGLLDAYGWEKATFVGHDWGAVVVWDLARHHPDRVEALCAMSVPYLESPAPPTEIFEAVFAGRFFYMLYFQPVGPAERELEGDVRRFVRNILWSASGDAAGSGSLTVDAPREGTGFLDVLADAPDDLPAWLTEHDVDVYAEAFRASGFFGPLGYYRNLDANWRRARDVPASTLAMPTAFVTGSMDPVRLMSPGAEERMESVLPDFRGTTVVEGAGHWVQQERPTETNGALVGFLATLS